MKKITSILLAVVLALTSMATAFSVDASAAKVTEVKGKTIAQVLGMDPQIYINWLTQHDSDDYYLGTTYKDGDHRNPNGDCKGTYGAEDSKGKAAMNCTGFVWHALYKATKSSNGNVSMIPGGSSNWVNFYRNNRISRRYFSSLDDMLDSGYLENGDIIWMFYNGKEDKPDDRHQVGIYWSDGYDHLIWHSDVINHISPFYYYDPEYSFVVLKSGAALQAPVVTKINQTANGIYIKWNKLYSAEKYRVFRKEGSKWKKLGDTTSTSWTNKTAKPGNAYVYTVRCVSKDGKNFTSPYYKPGWVIEYLASPKITKCEGVVGGTKIIWNKVPGAAQYRIFMKVNGKWKALADTRETSYTYYKIKIGVPTVFTVRCLSEDGLRYTSYYDTTGYESEFYRTPIMIKAEYSEEGLRFVWKKIDNYPWTRVFRMVNGKWKKLADVRTNNYLDITVEPGKLYTYTVRAMNSSKTAFTTGYYPVDIETAKGNERHWNHIPNYELRDPKRDREMLMPEMTGAVIERRGSTDYIKFSWNKIDGLYCYRIMIKQDGQWKFYDEETGNSTFVEITGTGTYEIAVLGMDPYTDEIYADPEEAIYSVDVKVFHDITGDKYYLFGDDPDEIRDKLIPTIVGVGILSYGGSNYIKITWQKIDGVRCYRVYIKKDGRWSVFDEEIGFTSYIDIDGEGEYEFAVLGMDPSTDRVFADPEDVKTVVKVVFVGSGSGGGQYKIVK